MEEKLKLSPDSFEALPQAQEPDNEKIAAPSLTFVQDAWRRLKMNKGALISFWIIILMMIVAFGSSFFINHSTLVKSAHSMPIYLLRFRVFRLMDLMGN